MVAGWIVSQDYEVGSRLDQLGLSASELIGVVHQAVAAKANFVLNHPLNAAGQLSYIYGTSALRDALRTKGWEIDRTGNIEATYNPSGRTLRSGTYSSTSMATTFVPNCHSRNGLRTGNSRASTNESTSSSPASGPA
jgi:hypothetical protein